MTMLRVVVLGVLGSWAAVAQADYVTCYTRQLIGKSIQSRPVPMQHSQGQGPMVVEFTPSERVRFKLGVRIAKLGESEATLRSAILSYIAAHRDHAAFKDFKSLVSITWCSRIEHPRVEYHNWSTYLTAIDTECRWRTEARGLDLDVWCGTRVGYPSEAFAASGKPDNAGCRGHDECQSGFCAGFTATKTGACKPNDGSTSTTGPAPTSPPTQPPSTTPTTPTTPPPPAAGIPDPLLMPTGDAVSIRIPMTSRCMFIGGRTATQPERLAMQLLNERLLPEAMAVGKARGCGNIDGGAHLNGGIAKRVYYKDKNRVGRIYRLANPNACDVYQFTGHTLERLRTCMTRNVTAATACGSLAAGAKPLLSTDLLAATGLAVHEGVCVVLPSFDDNDFPKEDPVLRDAGVVDYDKPLVLSDKFFAIVAASKVSHGQAKRFMTEPGLSLDERSAGVDVFPTGHDVGPNGWTAAEMADLDHITHVIMDNEWGGRCLTLPPNQRWACIDRARTSHNSFHDCMTVKTNDNLRVGNHLDKPQLTSLTARTCAEWLACIKTDPLSCDLPWAVGAF